MVTTWPNFQSRYIQIYKEGAYIRASVWQTDAYDKGTLDDWCEINLSGDLDFDYVSVAMSYGQAGAETSSGYIDPVFGAFENLSAEFIVRRSDSEDLACSFEVGQGSQDLAASFDAQVSLNLGASFEVGQGSLELAGAFISRQSDSEDLPAGFDVNYWYHVSHLVITTGSIAAGTVDNTRADDGNDLVLAETGLPADAFDYEFHWLNVPANQIFGIRLNGWYDGNPAHTIKLYEWNFTTPGWDAVTNAADDIPSAIAEQDYAWMAGGPDYVSGGEYRLRVCHISPGNPVHELNVDYLWLDISYAEFEDSPPAHFIARQPGSANLLGTFIVRHPGSQELGASFDGQVSLNLPAEFSSRRSTQQELAAEFTVNQSSKNLPAEFISRQPGSQALLGVMNIVHFLDLGAKFKVRYSSSENLMGAMISRQADSQTLIAAFSVIPEASTDLLGGFISRKTIAPVTGVIIAYDPRPWFNFELDVGTGFTGGIKEGSDKFRKAIGESSMRIATRYEEDRNDYVIFGWKYRYPQIPEQSRGIKGGFLVNQLPAVAEGLRDYTAAKGWWLVTEGWGDTGFEALLIPKTDGTIELFGRAITTTSEYLGFNTHRTWRPGLLGADPIIMVWEVEAGARIAPGSGSRYNSMTLGALYLSDIPYYPSGEAIYLIYDGEPGATQGLFFYTVENGQGESTDLTGVWNPEIKHKYKIVWYSNQVLLYVDNVLRATHSTRVPKIDLHFGLGIEAVNDQPAPDTCDVSLIFHSFSPLL